MKVVIIQFSPSGNTKKVAHILANQLEVRQIDVRLIDITKNAKYLNTNTLQQQLRDTIPDHDLLCIGSPVYSKHLHYNVKNLIKALPPPRNGWGHLTVPFVTWGGVSSGVALQEAGRLLKDSGRTVVAGMKIVACHSLSKCFSKRINPGMPGDEAIPVVTDLADRIARLSEKALTLVQDNCHSLAYQGVLEKLKSNLIFNEKMTHKTAFSDPVFDHGKCDQCRTCVKICPVQRLEMTNTGPVAIFGGSDCIHCSECFYHCPSKAITFNLKRFRLETLIALGAEGKGILANHETPHSAVYPIHSGSCAPPTSPRLKGKDTINSRTSL